MDKVPIPLSRPDISEDDINSVVKILKTPYLSLGPALRNFEKNFSEYLQLENAIAVNSGTSGLDLCVRSLGIKKGDEVITTSFSFIASANCILYSKATPVFVDIDPQTYNIDPQKIEAKITNKTKAIIPVHIFGHPSDMDPIMKISTDHSLKIIEDACEAIGAEYNGKKVGTFGNCAVIAFYPNKQMTTGEGGMIVTNDKNISNFCLSVRNQGRDIEGSWFGHVRLGFNYRLSDILCALGISQLNRIEKILSIRENIAEKYNSRLSEVDGVRIPIDSKNVKRSWFLYVIELEENYTKNDRDIILDELRKANIECKAYFPPIHLQPFYQKILGLQKDLPITEYVAERTIALPFYNRLSDMNINYICDTLENILKRKMKS